MPESALQIAPEVPEPHQKLCDKLGARGANHRYRAPEGRHGSASKCAASPAPRLTLRCQEEGNHPPCVRLPYTKLAAGACPRRKRCDAWRDEWKLDTA